MPTATPPLPFTAGEPTRKTPFPFLKNLGGGISKICKGVFLAGRSGQTCPLGGGAGL